MSTKFELQGKKLTFRYTDIDGIRKRYTCKSSLKKEAELERNEFLAQLNQSKKHNGKYNINTLLWPHFCQLYINNYVIANNIEPSVIKALIKQINDILNITFLTMEIVFIIFGIVVIFISGIVEGVVSSI